MLSSKLWKLNPLVNLCVSLVRPCHLHTYMEALAEEEGGGGSVEGPTTENPLFTVPFDYGTWRDLHRLRRTEAVVVDELDRLATQGEYWRPGGSLVLTDGELGGLPVAH